MVIKERGNGKQMTINMAATFVNFIVGLGISFFLTPFIVKSLGAEAYGFIGLSTNIISYTQLLTVALNSMASRFIAISYNRGDIDNANKYMSSVFYSNILLAGIILFAMIIVIVYLEFLIDIPDYLIIDVKILFSLLLINTLISLLTNVYNVSTFIKNRLDLSSIRSIVASLLRVASICILFGFFHPYLWYIGVSGMIMSIYVAFTNYRYTLVLTPDLIVSKKYFDLKKVYELLKSGVWNLISRLAEILGIGLDMLVANLFLGATCMGIFSLTKNVPFLILSLFQTISNVFAPTLTKLYAVGDIDSLISEFHKSIRILSFCSTIPICLLYVWGDSFYGLWLPTQDSQLLQVLTIVGTLEFSLAMPLQGLWNIFTITNKLKYSTLTMLINNILVISIVVGSMYILDDDTSKLMVLAASRSVVGIIRSATFLPMYGAYCLNQPITIFFKPLVRSLASFVSAFAISFLLKQFIEVNTWGMLILVGLFTVIIGVIINSLIILEKKDRVYLLNRIKVRL